MVLKANAILVQNDSPIKTLEDLKGKKVGVAKGSSGFDLLNNGTCPCWINPRRYPTYSTSTRRSITSF